MEGNRTALRAQLKFDRDKPFSNVLDLVERFEEIESDENAQITVFESEERLSKHFYLDEEGKLASETGGKLAKGRALRVPIPNLRSFATLLSRLTPNQALSFGVFGGDAARVRVVTQRALKTLREVEPDTSAIARDQAHFAWPAGAGIMMFEIAEQSRRPRFRLAH